MNSLAFTQDLARFQVQQWATYVHDTGIHIAMELLLHPQLQVMSDKLCGPRVSPFTVFLPLITGISDLQHRTEVLCAKRDSSTHLCLQNTNTCKMQAQLVCALLFLCALREAGMLIGSGLNQLPGSGHTYKRDFSYTFTAKCSRWW